MLTAQDDCQPDRYQRAQGQLEKAITRETIDIDAACEALRSTSAGERLAIKRGFGSFQGLLEDAVSRGQIQVVEKWLVTQLVCGFDAKVCAEQLRSAPAAMTKILKAMSGEQAYVTAPEYRRRYGEDVVVAAAKAGANGADVMQCIQHLSGEKALIAAKEWREAGSIDKQGKIPMMQVIGALDSQEASLQETIWFGYRRGLLGCEITPVSAQTPNTGLLISGNIECLLARFVRAQYLAQQPDELSLDFVLSCGVGTELVNYLFDLQQNGVVSDFSIDLEQGRVNFHLSPEARTRSADVGGASLSLSMVNIYSTL